MATDNQFVKKEVILCHVSPDDLSLLVETTFTLVLEQLSFIINIKLQIYKTLGCRST